MNRDLFLVILALSVWGIGEGMFFNFQSLNLERLGADPISIGGILGLVGAAMAVAHLPAGYLADRVGRRPLLLVSWWAGCIATAVMALSSNLTGFVAGMVLYGLTAFVAVPLNAYVISARGKMRSEQVITLVAAAFNGGSILGPSIGGWIGQEWGLHSVFYAAFFLFVISTTVVWQIRSQPIEPRGQHDSHWHDLASKPFLRFLFIAFLAFFAMYISQPLAANFLQNERDLTLSQIGFLISGRSLGVVVFSLGLGTRPAKQGFLLGMFGIAVYNLLMWQGNEVNAFLGAFFLLGNYNIARSMIAVISSKMVRTENMGLAFGAIETVLGIVAISAPPLAGLIYSVNPVFAFPVGFIGVMITGLLAFLYLPHMRLAKSKEITSQNHGG